MKYLRTPDEIIEYCQENKIAEISMSTITKSIEDNFKLSQLGYFHSIFEQGFWTYKKRGGNVEQQNQFRATPNVLDFIINSGILSDATGEYPTGKGDSLGIYSHKIVKLFGKTEGGLVVELIGFNTGNYFETAFTNKYTEQKKTKSVDLWF